MDSGTNQHEARLDLEGLQRVLARRADERCVVSPSPDLAARIKAEVERLNGLKRVRSVGAGAALRQPRHPGFNDGMIIPGSYFPLGTPIDRVRSAAAERAPLHGILRVAVILVDFDDQEMVEDAEHFDDLFFSEGELPNGSVREYFTDVTNGLVELTGEVLGPYRLPRDMAEYANGESGIGNVMPNSRTMANDAAVAADPDLDFGPYDNDGDGFVDAFVVVHAGSGAEETGALDQIWSHKWVLPSVYSADTSSIFAYLTVPEDARIGVCAHELGHLLFGFPDLYDTDNSSEGIGNWCLMAGGSWGGGGDTPTHPSAWCKAQQGWVTVDNVTTNQALSLPDVKDSHTVHRVWKDGAGGQEYFLLENRQADRRDVSLPGSGLLIWHIDDAVTNNTDETHYKVALEQADGNRDLEGNTNRGDGGDCWPGSSDNRAFTASSTPNSTSYGGVDTCVAVTAISDPGTVMTATVQVQCGKAPLKDTKDVRDTAKEIRKEFIKDKDFFKEHLKERFKEGKDHVFDKDRIKEHKEFAKDKERFKEDKEPKEVYEDKFTDGKPTDGTPGESGFGAGRLDALERRLAGLEAGLAAVQGAPAPGASPVPGPVGAPFIGAHLRPDLAQSALANEPGGTNPSGPVDKRLYDAPPPGAAMG